MKTGILKFGGGLLACAGLLGLAAGALHPQGGVSQDYHRVVATMLGSAQWPAAHWIALVFALCAAWAFWLLIDAGWMQPYEIAWAGARLATLACLFMAVEFAVELASRAELNAYALGQSTSLVSLVEPMQAVGWPALGIGYALIALGAPTSAPLVLRVLGAVGAAALAIGGILVEGFHIAAFGPLFALGGLAFLWLIWTGVKIVLTAEPVRQSAAQLTAA